MTEARGCFLGCIQCFVHLGLIGQTPAVDHDKSDAPTAVRNVDIMAVMKAEFNPHCTCPIALRVAYDKRLVN
jgi:hypothetical protein